MKPQPQKCGIVGCEAEQWIVPGFVQYLGGLSIPTAEEAAPSSWTIHAFCKRHTEEATASAKKDPAR